MRNKIPKQGYGFIYKYTSPSGKSYIGQTIRSLKQRAGHNGKAYKGCDLFYKAIRKYGLENFDVEILKEVKIENLNDEEIKFIQVFNTLAPAGYNLSVGGQKICYHTTTIYVYDNDGNFVAEYESVKDAAKALNTVPSTITTAIASGNCHVYDCYVSRIKMENFPIKDLIDNKKRKVRCYDLNHNLVKEFSSIIMAARETNSERSAIRKCCRHELKTHNGYIWECDECLLTKKKFNNVSRSIEKLDKETLEVIQTYPSISAAARELNLSGTSLIRRALNNSHYSAYGYKWQYAQGSTTTCP